jgi:Flp pilus assembly protein TadG
MSKPLHMLRTLRHGFVGDLARDRSAVAMIEFAFAAPLVLTMGMLGSESAYMVVTHMQVSQIAMQVADNASRVGEQDVLTARKVYERDIAETLIGAEKLGDTINIFEQGRVIISSLQRNAQGGQWIAWQRCRGAKVYNSSYGVQGNGATGTGFPGMGEPGRYITAAQGTAVMFVEVSYDYQSLTPFDLYEGNTITYTAAFNIRDNRDLTQLYAGGPVARCNTYSAARPV